MEDYLTMAQQSEFGKHRRKVIAEAKKHGHVMINPESRGFSDRSPWEDSDGDGDYWSVCLHCSYEVNTFQNTFNRTVPVIETYHYERINPGEQKDLTAIPECTHERTE